MPSDGQAGGWFGSNMRLDGDRLAVSARNDDDNGEDSGSAYIFERVGTSWVETEQDSGSDDKEPSANVEKLWIA